VSLIEEEHELRIFESGVRKKLVGPKSGEVRRDTWKLNNEELRDIFNVFHVRALYHIK
jgi:hypothetical protein